jgi:hypothetical protein
MRRSLLAALFLTLLGAPAGDARLRECRLDEGNRTFLDKALHDWQTVVARDLQLPHAPLPWILAFDRECAWNLAPEPATADRDAWKRSEFRFRGQPLFVSAEPHGGEVRPPSGQPFPVSPRVYAAHAASLGRAYFVMALPDVFAADPQAAKDPLLRERLRSVVSHELLHTRQLPDVAAQIKALRERFTLPDDIDDNVIERRFGSNAEFRKAWEHERDLFYAAVADENEKSASRKTLDAIALMRARQARFYTGAESPFARIEQLFLNMEGAAEWVRYKIHEHDHAHFKTHADIILFIRGRENDWVQDEGLALVLLLDRFASGWQRQLLTPDMASPLDVLERAMSSSGARR